MINPFIRWENRVMSQLHKVTRLVRKRKVWGVTFRHFGAKRSVPLHCACRGAVG